MHNKNQSIKGLADLSDDKLQGLVTDITKALGADPRKAKGLDVSRLRATLNTISEEDAKKLIDRAGKDKAEEIYRAIQRSKG